mmetsp:Transcript_35242/g.64421  ORF Transcript_35242/g.64421 Transcript_35242/m.64421 type:complete len:744 (-) Transcript_35242:148-2379(-)
MTSGTESGLGGIALAAAEFLRKFPKDSPCAGPDELRWINYMMNVTWPHMRQVLIAKGKNEILERGLMELQKHKDMKVQSFEVEFDPGGKPPVLKGLHAYKKEQEEHASLEVDVDLEWTPGREFVLKPKLKGSFNGIPIDTGGVYVSGLEFSSVVSGVLSPFVDYEPCFGVMQIFFYDPPGVRMYMHGLKQMNRMGQYLKNIMEKVMLKAMEEAFVLPHRLIVPVRHDLALETLVSMKSPLPIGLLEVEVLEAENLLAADTSLTGKASSDPYVKVKVGLASMRSSTIASTLNPKWSDGPDYLLVYNLSQTIRVEVYDDDQLGFDLIGLLPGYNVYWLCQEAEGKPEGQWFQLQAPESGDMKDFKDAGRIKLRIRYLDLSDLDQGDQLQRQSTVEVEEPWARTPHLVSVKLLGLEGELAGGFMGSRCTVELLTPQQKVLESDEGGNTTETEDDAKGLAAGPSARLATEQKPATFFQKGFAAFTGIAKAVEEARDKFKAATGIGFGERERAVPTKGRTSKAKLWSGHIKEQRNSAAFAVPPMAVRAIEQLHRREGWDVAKIAEMFGVEEEAVLVAQGLRTNFACVWHESLHFVSTHPEPYAPIIKIDVNAAPGPVEQKNRKGGANTRQLVGEGGLIGSLKLDLSHATLIGDTPWKRRVRARLRRKQVDQELNRMVSEHPDEVLHGEHQCDTSIGDVVPGILLEFLIEVRGTRSSHSHNHLEKEQVVIDKDELVDSTRKRVLEVVLT